MAKDTVTLHERIVSALVEQDPAIQRTSFRKNMRKLLDDLDSDPVDGVPIPAIVPDAYKIDRENKAITLYEVEITGFMTDDKLYELGWMAFYLDCDQPAWYFYLTRIDRRGVATTSEALDLYYSHVIPACRQASAA